MPFPTEGAEVTLARSLLDVLVDTFVGVEVVVVGPVIGAVVSSRFRCFGP